MNRSRVILFLIINTISLSAIANSYIAINICKIRYDETSYYYRAEVTFSGLNEFSLYEGLDSAKLIPPSGERLNMLSRSSSRSLSLSRYVPIAELGGFNGLWQIELFASGVHIDTLSFNVGKFNDDNFRPFPSFPEGRIHDDPYLIRLTIGIGDYKFNLGEAIKEEALNEEGHIYRLPSNRVVRASTSRCVFVYSTPERRRYSDAMSLDGHPPGIIYSLINITNHNIKLYLTLESVSERWFAPGLIVNDDKAALSEILHINETVDDENNSIELLEDETGQPLLLYFTDGARTGTFTLEKSNDLKRWEVVMTIESDNNIVPFLVNLNDEKVFLRVVNQ